MRSTTFLFFLMTTLCLLPAANCAAADSQFDDVRFFSDWVQSENFHLTDGMYQEPAAPGSASSVTIRLADKTASGVINGQMATLVVLAADAGGSGVFYDLALLKQTGDTLRHTVSLFLGDRIRVKQVAIQNNQIEITWTAPAPDEPMTKSSMRVFKTFSLEGDELRETLSFSERVVDSDEDSPAISHPMNRLWSWQKSIYNNDTSVEVPPPGNYTIKLLPDGIISAQIDCNQAGGTYTLEGNRLKINITHATMAICPDDMLDMTFQKDLAGVNSFFVKEDTLYLELQYDSGTMVFK